MVPEGWVVYKIDDVATVSTGGTPERSRREYWGGNIPWVTTGEISNGLITDTKECITEAGLRGSAAKIFPAGTLLMAIYGQGRTRGQIALLGIDAATNQACSAITAGKKLCRGFLYQNLASRYDEIRNLSNDGSQKNLSGGIIKSLPILLPPLPEQRRIAAVLDAWDTAIATAERLVVAKQLQKRNVTDHLMTQSNDCVLLGSLGHFEKGRGLAKTVLSDTGISCLRYAEIYTRYGDTTYSLISRTSEAGARASKALQRGDIVFAASGETAEEIGKAIAYLGSERAVVGGDTVVLAGHGQDAGFLARLLNSPKLVRQKAALGKGHSVVHIHAPDLAQLMVPLPSLADQQRIAAAFEVIENEISGLEAVSDRLRHQKRGLMQQLLTGRLRVPESIDRLMPGAGGGV